MKALPVVLLLSLPAHAAYTPGTHPEAFLKSTAMPARHAVADSVRKAMAHPKVRALALTAEDAACASATLLAQVAQAVFASLAGGPTTPVGYREVTDGLEDAVWDWCDGRGGGPGAVRVREVLRREGVVLDVPQSPRASDGLGALRGAAGAGVGLGAGRPAASPATPILVVDPERLPDVRPPALRKTRPEDVL